MFSQPVDSVSNIVETDEGFFLVHVRQKEVRPVDEAVRAPIVARSYAQTLETAREDLGSEILLTTTHVNRLANHFATSLNAGG